MTFTVRDCETSAKTVHCRIISPRISQQELGPTTYSVSNDYTVGMHALLHNVTHNYYTVHEEDSENTTWDDLLYG